MVILKRFSFFFFLRLVRIMSFVMGGVLALGSFAQANQFLLKTRIGVHPHKTRLVLELPAKITYKISRNSSPTHQEIIIKRLNLKDLYQNSQKGKGLIHSFFFRKQTSDTLVFHIKTTKKSCLNAIFLIPGNEKNHTRLVVDVKEVKRQGESIPSTSSVVCGLPKKSSSPLSSFMPIPFRKPVRYTVVIDAGHGGQDPGTIGLNNLFEKNITLTLAREVKEQLTKHGRYHVVLTREKDQFMRLRDRFARARGVRADLFISLHADSHPNKKVHGLSVYTLSDQASDKEAALLAKKENKADVIGGFNFKHESIEVANILIDLTQRYTMDLSINFAQEILNCIAKEQKLSENSHRFADFEVLKAPDVPSVLVEVGYLSNFEDTARLSQKKFRQGFAFSMVRAINQYFQKLKR